VNLHLDNQPLDLNETDAKTFFVEKTDSLLKYLTKETFLVKLLQNLLFSLTMFAQTEDDHIYLNSPQSLPAIRQSLLILLEPYEYFNTHILEKRKDKLPKYKPEEIKDPLYTYEEFCELKLA
jgi:ribosomal protein S15P/S13E